MANWFARFWYHDTIDEMQRKMLSGVHSNRYKPRIVWYEGFSSEERTDWREPEWADELPVGNDLGYMP